MQFICVLHDKKVAARMIAQKIENELGKSFCAENYEVISVLYDAATKTVEILKQVGYDHFVNKHYDFSYFLKQLAEAESRSEKKVLIIEANLGITAGSTLSALALDTIEQLKPNALTLVAGEEALEQMKIFQKPNYCSVLEVCTHQTILTSISNSFRQLFPSEDPQSNKSWVRTTHSGTDKEYGQFILLEEDDLDIDERNDQLNLDDFDSNQDGVTSRSSSGTSVSSIFSQYVGSSYAFFRRVLSRSEQTVKIRPYPVEPN